MNLFIDTNIFLHFYEYSGDDLDELRKLTVLIKNSDLKLFLPQQVIDEFKRQRDGTLAKCLNDFKRAKFETQFPQVTKHYDQYQKMREAIQVYDENKQALLKRLKDDIIKNKLKADDVIKGLFSKAKKIPLTDEVIQKAKLRFDLGNPPGKHKSYGDAINWITLLDEAPDFEPFVFISDDNDFYSEFDNKLFNPYLFEEWNKKKISELKHFKNLTDFFRENYPEIKLADELEKNLLIEKFAASGTFATTHSLLNRLAEINDFTREQVNDILLAAVSNSQIYWIASDEDINDNLTKIIVKHTDLIDPDLFNQFLVLYPQDSDFEDGDEP